MITQNLKLLNSNLLYELVDSYPDGIFVINKEMKIKLFNKMCENITGQKGKQVVEKNLTCDKVFKCCTEDGKKYPVSLCPGKNVFRGTPSIESKEMIIKTANNVKKYVLLSYYPIKKNNSIEYVVGIVKDIGEKKTMERELHLSKKLASLGEILTEIVHEIKNPLGIIVSASEIITNEKRPQAQKRKAAELIKDEVKLLDKRIKSFLMFAKPKPIICQDTNINNLIRKIVATYYASASNEFKITLNLDNKLPLLFIDPEQMKEAFFNFIINADNAVSHSGNLKISTYRKNNFVYVSFQDNGEGIDKENFDKIFEPFFSTKPDGTGLGLVIVQNIIREHKGTITIESEKSKGSTFTIKLPVFSGVR